jgi:hypothetical protein
MQISSSALEEFVSLYRGAFGEEPTPEQALEAGSRLIGLYEAMATARNTSTSASVLGPRVMDLVKCREPLERPQKLGIAFSPKSPQFIEKGRPAAGNCAVLRCSNIL